MESSHPRNEVSWRYTYSAPRQFGSMDVRPAPDVKPFVFIVDDDVSVRESLEVLIKRAGWQPELFASAQEFLSRPRSAVPSCLVLDVHLPGLDGLELQRLLADKSEVPIVFITGHGDVPISVQAMKAGAVEFLTKPINHEMLLRAIQDAIERSRAALRLQSEMRAMRKCYGALTPRQRQVMELVVAGRLNKQIAGALGISEITVKMHRGQVMRKMKARSLPSLVVMADRLGVRRQPGL
jgi:FixJ family two-component response regulator